MPDQDSELDPHALPVTEVQEERGSEPSVHAKRATGIIIYYHDSSGTSPYMVRSGGWLLRLSKRGPISQNAAGTAKQHMGP